MINRWIGIATLGLMLSVNAALLIRDVLPDWLAGEPPKSRALALQPGQQIQMQVGIFDSEGRRVGYSWTRSDRSGHLVAIHNKTVLRSLGLPHELATLVLRIDTDMRYHGTTVLDELRVRVTGLDMPIRLEGEFVPPDTFPCAWQVGDRRGHFVLPAAATRAVGDVFRPFESLAGLYVGQSWRVELLSPLAGIVPGWGARNMMTDSVLVRVVGQEPVEHRGVPVEAFVLEAEDFRAWVGPDGRVIRQEVELPLFGVLSLVDERYDEETRWQVLMQTPAH